MLLVDEWVTEEKAELNANEICEKIRSTRHEFQAS